MTKVCHMTSAHGPEDVRIFYKECVSLARAGYEVYLVERGDSYEKNGVHIVGVGEPGGGRLRRMTSFVRKVYRKALELDADIYHFHDPELLPYGLKLKRRGKKVIFDSHENTSEQILDKTWIPWMLRKIVYDLFRWYQRYVCRRLDALITVTPHICDTLQRFNTNTWMITNYPILETSTEMPQHSNNMFGFAGGIIPLWSHEKIIAAIQLVGDCEYVLCGKASEKYLNELKCLPGWRQVDYRGLLPHSEISRILGICTAGFALAQKSRNGNGDEGTLGNTKLFEEMMARLPVICTDFVLWRNIVEKYQCGICIDPNDIDAIAKAIRYLLNHPEEARQMGQNGRRAVELEFNWGIEERKLLNLYRTLFPV